MGKKQTSSRQRIIEIATPLFLKRGFTQVDMRLLAESAGVAVGTLYNYFPTKGLLFGEVFESSWQSVFARLEQIRAAKLPAKERIQLFLVELYHGVRARQGLGLELLKASLSQESGSEDSTEQERIHKVGAKLRGKLGEIILETSLGKDYAPKLARSLIVSCWALAKEGSNQAEDNLKFLNWLVEQTIRD